MKTTKVTGQLCVGELRLAAIDVGFDLRLTGTAVRFPADTPASAGFNGRNGRETYLIEDCTREDMIATLRRAGYKIV